MTAFRLLLAASLLGLHAQSPVSPSRALVDEGIAHTSSGRLDDAVRVLREAVASAADQGQRGRALRALAQATSLKGDLAGANALFEEALSALRDAGDTTAIGALWNQRANDAFRRAAQEEAERYWLESLRVFRSAGRPADEANALRNLCFLPRLSTGDRIALLDEAWSVLGSNGERDPYLAGLIRDSQSGTLYSAGDYAAALSHAEEAVRLLEASSPRSLHFARSLTSLGRMKRLMGNPAAALELNQRAVVLLEQVRDFDGAAQASHASANALLELKGIQEYSRMMDTAVAYAQQSNRPTTLPGILTLYADTLAQSSDGDVSRAQALIGRVEGARAEFWQTLRARARILGRLGQHGEALALVDRAIGAQPPPAVHEQALLHVDRSQLLERLGRLPEAIESLGRAIAIIESGRQRLVPADETRRGYAERWRYALARQVRLLAQNGQMDVALVASERARSRAFVNLLAARDAAAPHDQVSSNPAPAPVAALPERGSRPPRLSTLDDLLADIKQRMPGAQDAPLRAALDAEAAAAPASLAEITSASAALATHFLVYWTGNDQTLIWVVAPDGRITAGRSAIGETRLAALVQSTWASPETVAVRAEPPGGVIAAQAGKDGKDGDAVPAWAPALRGDGTLVFDSASQRAFRELDRVLIAPVRAVLPKGETARVTIVPHGPLFRLSFAPLLSPAGRYLIEQARLSYTPSITALLRLRAPLPPSTVGAASLVVADPELSTAVVRGERLARLPGASAEGRAISTLLGTRTTLLSGRTASESQVRNVLSGARVVHFATHGVIRDDEPMSSYLALGGSAASSHDDGRLTAAEVYDLSLDADLVVLSACRSAVGPVTGDGITGLSRAFFAAGSRSVMASLWDLPDVVTAPLLARFYREWQSSRSKADALRRAQLHMIRELRGGRIAVDTPAGRYVVPEHPSLWAGLVLMGAS